LLYKCRTSCTLHLVSLLLAHYPQHIHTCVCMYLYMYVGIYIYVCMYGYIKSGSFAERDLQLKASYISAPRFTLVGTVPTALGTLGTSFAPIRKDILPTRRAPVLLAQYPQHLAHLAPLLHPHAKTYTHTQYPQRGTDPQQERQFCYGY